MRKPTPPTVTKSIIWSVTVVANGEFHLLHITIEMFSDVACAADIQEIQKRTSYKYRYDVACCISLANNNKYMRMSGNESMWSLYNIPNVPTLDVFGTRTIITRYKSVATQQMQTNGYHIAEKDRSVAPTI